jgi:Tol biopolymer transport system component
VTKGEGEFAPSCSPDGTWLTYGASEPSVVGVWRLPIDGGKPIRIWEHYGLSEISPDGKWVLIRDFLTRKAIVIPASGGQQFKTFDPDPQWGLPRQWTADSRGFFYVRTNNGVSNVWQRSLDGVETRQVTNFDSDQISTQFGVALSRDGKQLAVARGSTTSDIVLIKDLNAR